LKANRRVSRALTSSPTAIAVLKILQVEILLAVDAEKATFCRVASARHAKIFMVVSAINARLVSALIGPAKLVRFLLMVFASLANQLTLVAMFAVLLMFAQHASKTIIRWKAAVFLVARLHMVLVALSAVQLSAHRALVENVRII